MQIDWNSFTPWSSLYGGILIGVATTLLLLGLGRIAGVIGIIAGLLPPNAKDWLWRFTFIIGLILAPFIYTQFAPMPSIQLDADWLHLIIAGLLVGIGTRYGSGCTSGHGICGIARGSLRSVLATVTFMASGIATVFVLRHFLHPLFQ